MTKIVNLHPDNARVYLSDLKKHHANVSRSLGNVPRIISATLPGPGKVKIEQPYVPGNTLKEILASQTPRQSTAHYRKVLDYILPAVSQGLLASRKRTGSPIDTNPSNFIIGPTNKVHYVDITPPYLVYNDGSVSFWENRKMEIKDQVFRKFEPAGIVQNLLFHSVRANPALRKQLERQTLAFLKENGLSEEARHLRSYIGSKEYLESLAKPTIKKMTSGSIQVKRSIR